jgi:hypothetical protein
MLFVLMLLAPVGASQARSDDASFLVRSGMWEWKQETRVAGLPIRETNLECVDDEKAQMTLRGLAFDLDEACTVAGVKGPGPVFKFDLICSGDIPGVAAATLAHTMETMSLEAEGKARPFGLPIGFSMTAQARYVGPCPASQAPAG